MPSRFTITEPHPTVRQNTYIMSGRGGAGNHLRAPATTPSAGVPTPLNPVTSNTSTSSTSSRFYSGRGGAGNAHSQIERPVLSFEDEFSRADKRETGMASGYLVGRGGAGNYHHGTGLGGGKKSRTGSSSSHASSSSSGSTGSGVLRKLGGVFKH